MNTHTDRHLSFHRCNILKTLTSQHYLQFQSNHREPFNICNPLLQGKNLTLFSLKILMYSFKWSSICDPSPFVTFTTHHHGTSPAVLSLPSPCWAAATPSPSLTLHWLMPLCLLFWMDAPAPTFHLGSTTLILAALLCGYLLLGFQFLQWVTAITLPTLHGPPPPPPPRRSDLPHWAATSWCGGFLHPTEVLPEQHRSPPSKPALLRQSEAPDHQSFQPCEKINLAQPHLSCLEGRKEKGKILPFTSDYTPQLSVPYLSLNEMILNSCSLLILELKWIWVCSSQTL